MIDWENGGSSIPVGDRVDMKVFPESWKDPRSCRTLEADDSGNSFHDQQFFIQHIIIKFLSLLFWELGLCLHF